MPRAVTVVTPTGPARARIHRAGNPRAALVLGHGAGGGIDAPDLTAATAVALAANLNVALVEQPYRVAGRRSAAPAARLDEAWLAVVEHLSSRQFKGLPLITGGRSSGARVACRTAAASGAVGVLCLAFPLVSPKGVTRQLELDLPAAPVLVVQGTTDRFGMPEPAPGREVAQLRGDHGLKSDMPGLRAAVADWLARLPV